MDGTNFRIQRRGTTAKEPSLVVLGITQENRMSILAVEPGSIPFQLAIIDDDINGRGLKLLNKLPQPGKTIILAKNKCQSLYI